MAEKRKPGRELPRREGAPPPPGTVSPRSGTRSGAASGAAREKLSKTAELARAAKESRRQAVWNKLDSAKRKAEAKGERLRGFQPARATPAADDFDLDES